MLPKTKRFNIKDALSTTPARVLRGRVLLLKVFPNAQKHNRFAVSVGKKLSKTATGRNKIKRAVMNALGKLDSSISAKGLDLLITPLPSAIRETNPEHAIIRELKELIFQL